MATVPTQTRSPAIRELVEATPASRERTVDALRALCIVVVVLWHWTFSVTHWTTSGRLTMPNPIGEIRLLWLATWLFQVMPLFFVVGGFANLASWDAVRARGQGVGAFLRTRISRLGRPVLVLVAAWSVLELVLTVIRPGHRSVIEWGEVVFIPLWFLAAYALVIVLVPITTALHRRGPELVVVALGSAILLADLGRFRWGVDVLAAVNTVLVWVFAHQLGYVWRDGSVLRGGRTKPAALVLAGLCGLIGLTNLGVYPRSMVGVAGEPISNMFPTTACVAALAVLQLGVALLLRPVLSTWLRRRGPWTAVVAVNAVAMTVFTWHMTALVIAIGAWGALGLALPSEATTAWWLTRPVWVLLPALALVPLVLAFRKAELRG